MAWLLGTGGPDTLTGGAEDDLIIGNGGADRLLGGAGDDNIDLWDRPAESAFADGQEGDDGIIAKGNGTLNGGAGNDVISVDGGAFVVDGGSGDDYISVTAASYVTATLGAGQDVVQGYLRVGAPAVAVTDFQVGDSGDRLFIQPNTVRNWDGATNPFALGYYRITQQGPDALLQWDPDGPAGAQYGWNDVVHLKNVQTSQLTAWNLYGWAADGSAPAGLVLNGEGAADRLEGGKGPDTVSGGDGADTLLGGIGHDVVTGGAGADSMSGSSGNDQLFGDDGHDVIYGEGGSNFIRGGAGDDYINASTNSTAGSFNDLHGNVGHDTLEGGRGGDWVVGGQGHDVLFGAGDGDVVYGNLGDDQCSGGDGDDWVRGGQGNDSLDGGYGNDFMAGDRGSDTLSGGMGADVFHAFSGVGLDRITDFNAAEGDRVNLLAGTTYALRQEGPDTIVDMGNGDQVVLVGVTLSSLPAGWIFVG